MLNFVAILYLNEIEMYLYMICLFYLRLSSLLWLILLVNSICQASSGIFLNVSCQPLYSLTKIIFTICTHKCLLARTPTVVR